MPQVSIAPNIDKEIITGKALPGSMLYTIAATAMPLADSINAFIGTPLSLILPKNAGASPARDKLNIMRVEM